MTTKLPREFVTARSVLIYVEEKEAAFRAFHRVLRPGGRASLFEPINNYFPDDGRTPDAIGRRSPSVKDG